jgi:hypothetical protein
MESSPIDDADAVSVEALIRQLERDSEDLDYSLDKFTSERHDILASQQRALAEYEAEISRIEAEYGNKGKEPVDTSRKGTYVDHNILKHLNIEKQNDILANEQAAETEQNQTLGSLLLHLPEKKKSLIDPQLDHSQPPPSFDEKRKSREKMFNFMEESAIEETRLELEIEQAKENNDTQLVEDLSDALLLVQRMNLEQLSNLVTNYKPTPFTRNWGNDPEYLAMSKQLRSITEVYNTGDQSLPEVIAGGGGGVKGRR